MASALSTSLALLRLSPPILPFPPPLPRSLPRPAAGKLGSHGAAHDPELLRRPLVSAPSPVAPYASSSVDDEDGDENVVVGVGVGVGVVAPEAEDESGTGSAGQGLGFQEKRRSRRGRSPYEDWVDWEDLILQDTVPLVGFVRTILHSGKYERGDRLSPEHGSMIMDRLLPYHPEFKEKIGCGIDYITIGFHPEFENSCCLFIVREDGELVDFSYWKCIKGFIRKKYPLYAETFILRHFGRRKYNERSELTKRVF